MTSVFLYVPNLIGYTRIILALCSFWFMRSNYIITVICYVVSGLLDALDGHAARYLNQCSKFGAMLDMLTDRSTTMCLLVTLSYFYPNWMFFFQLSMTVDIVSHWLHMHVSLLSGQTSHKSMDLSKNKLLYHYYTNKKFLFFMCFGNEMFYCSLYLLHFTIGPQLFGIGFYHVAALLSFPIAIVKSGISLVHLWAASVDLVDMETKSGAAVVTGDKTD